MMVSLLESTVYPLRGGVVGYLMRKLDYPMAPAVLAIVLGPLVEPALRQSLIGSQGSFLVFVERPIAATILAIAAMFIFVLPLGNLIKTALANRAAGRRA